MQGYLCCVRIWWKLTDTKLVSIDRDFFKTDLASFCIVSLAARQLRDIQKTAARETTFCKDKKQFVYV